VDGGRRDYGRAVWDTGEFGQRQARVSAELDQLVRRLARLSPRSWRDARQPVIDLIATLVEVSARVHGRAMVTPSLDDHVLTDAVAVIGRDLLDSLDGERDAVILNAAGSAIEAALKATR
jgi:hypothetical protein